MPWTLALDEPAALDATVSGGKGAGLARLLAAKLPVPPGFVVRPEAMDACVAAREVEPPAWSDAEVRAEAARRAEALLAVPLPAGLREEIATRLEALGGVAVAVRSSAQDEDGRVSSAAGQYESILRVRGIDEVESALRRCWASVFSHRAAIYRARRGLHPFRVRASVVVQRMVEGECAGVLFTRDPVAPATGPVVVEAARGEAVVGGTALVDRYEIARREPLAIARRLAASSGAPLLDDERVLELARVALAAEAALGAPADVEWAYEKERGFSLLQLRPITPVAARRRGRRSGILWTQRFSGERWTEHATTLGWSIVEPALERFVYWPWASRVYLEGTRLARKHAEIPYFNVTIFRHLLPKTPWTPTPEFVLELFPADEAEELRRKRWHLPNLGLIALILAEVVLKARWRGHRWTFWKNPRDWQRLAPKIGRAAERATSLEELLPWLDRYVGVHVWSLLWANLFYQALGVFLERFGGRELHKLRPALVVGAGQENSTLRANVAVWKLAAIAAADPPLAKAILDAPDGRAALAVASPAFRAALEDVLARYGHRSRATWEVFSKRWRDEPETVVEMVRAYLRGGIAADPWLREEERVEERAAAERVVDETLRGWRRALVRWTVRHARVYSVLRENQRFVFDRLMLAIREACFASGRELVAARRLQDAADVVHLTRAELADLREGRLSAPEAARRIALRKREAAEAAGRWAPTFLFGDVPAPEAGPGRVLRGIGVSPGRYTGRVRVARSLADLANLRQGEVLVVKATDPGWTPYFASAGGLVTELGGLLSHAAVVAREYGLPAVANVPDATAVFADGESITLDGDEGLVWRG